MTLAVLKNRVLDHTDRSFDEARWGAGSFREFVGMFPEVVSVDSSTRPPTAELIEGPAREGPARPDAEAPVPAPVAAVLTPERRVRSDLWRAVLDYSSGKAYVWDGERAVQTKPQDAETERRPRLPTATPQDLAEWRPLSSTPTALGSRRRLRSPRGLACQGAVYGAAEAAPSTLEWRA